MSFPQKCIQVLGGQGAISCISIVAGVLFARSLGAGGMGQFELFRSTGVLLTTIAALGLGNASIFLINREGVKIQSIVALLLKSGALLGLAIGVVVYVIVLVFPDYFGAPPTIITFFFALGLSANLLKAILRPTLLAQLATTRLVVSDVFEPLMLVVGGGLLSLGSVLTPSSALLVLSASFIAGLGLLIFCLRTHIVLTREFEWALFKRLLSYGLKLAAGNLFYIASAHSMVFLLRSLRPEQFEELGLYTRAVAITGLALLVPNTVGSLLYAKWSLARSTRNISEVEQVMRFNAAYGLLCAAVLALGGKYILLILYGAQFTSASPALSILAWSTALMAFSGPLVLLLASEGRAASTAKILAASLGIILLSATLAIPQWGIQGAALAAFCGNAFTTFLALLLCRRLYGLRPLNCCIMKPSDFVDIKRFVFSRRTLVSPCVTPAR